MMKKNYLVTLIIISAILAVSAPLIAQQPPAPAIDEPTQHFRAGDAAYKTGDILTAVIEWETTLKLKPESAFTARQLAEAKTKWTPDYQTAYDIYGKIADLLTQKKWNDAELQIRAIQKLLHTTPKCVSRQLSELYRLKKLAQPPAAPDTSRIIKMHAEPQPQPGTYAIASANGVDILSLDIIPRPKTKVETDTYIQRLGQFRAEGHDLDLFTINAMFPEKCISCRIRNSSRKTFTSVVIDFSVFNKKGIRNAEVYTAYVRNLRPGDVVDWVDSSIIEGATADSRVRIDQITCTE